MCVCRKGLIFFKLYFLHASKKSPLNNANLYDNFKEDFETHIRETNGFVVSHHFKHSSKRTKR